jgi:hypothetical protein
MCGEKIEGTPYCGKVVRQHFGFAPGMLIRRLCCGCYCTLYGDYIIDRGGASENIRRGIPQTCEGCNDIVPHASMEALALYHLLAENIDGIKDKMVAHANELVEKAKGA